MNLEEFYDEYVQKVYKFFYIKILDKQTAEDLTAQTFVEFIEQTKVREIDDYKKYLYGIMRNVWLQFLRDKYDKALVSVENIDNFEEYVNEDTALFVEAETIENRLLPFISKLPEKQKEVFIKRMMENMSVKAIATEMGKDKNYVRTTYKRAVKSLRVMLDTPYMEVFNE